jgi:hypothetical protein
MLQARLKILKRFTNREKILSKNKLSSSKREARTAVLFIWSLLIIYPIMVVLGYYFENTQEIDIGMILLAFLATFICAGIMIVSLVMFLIWFYKAYSNLYKQTPLKYKKKWAVLGWLVPVINFYLPYLMVKEMYSNIAVLTNNSLAHESAKKLTTINIWWTLYILMWILDIAYYATIYPDTSAIFNIATYSLMIPSIWFTVKIIQDYCRFEGQLFLE